MIMRAIVAQSVLLQEGISGEFGPFGGSFEHLVTSIDRNPKWQYTFVTLRAPFLVSAAHSVRSGQVPIVPEDI